MALKRDFLFAAIDWSSRVLQSRYSSLELVMLSRLLQGLHVVLPLKTAEISGHMAANWNWLVGSYRHCQGAISGSTQRVYFSFNWQTPWDELPKEMIISQKWLSNSSEHHHTKWGKADSYKRKKKFQGGNRIWRHSPRNQGFKYAMSFFFLFLISYCANVSSCHYTWQFDPSVPLLG